MIDIAEVPRTAKGRATRERIVAAAANRMYRQGISGTSLDEVMADTATSKSQLYLYFPDKTSLVCAVIRWWQDTVLMGQQPYLSEFSTMSGLRAWGDHLVATNREESQFGGCPIGSLASEVASMDVTASATAAAAFATWRTELARGLERMKVTGELPEDADADDLALGLLAAVQGGLAVSKALQEIRPLEVALDQALRSMEALRSVN